ncbi:MAG: hypothetical protein ACOYCA_03285 [Eggerthellaceae bacterium]|jgi:hypothetical protein
MPENDETEVFDLEYNPQDIVAYLLDEDDKEVGFVLVDKEGVEHEYYYADDEPATAASQKNQGLEDSGVQAARELGEAAEDMRAIAQEGAQVAEELRDAVQDIKAAFDFKSIIRDEKRR